MLDEFCLTRCAPTPVVHWHMQLKRVGFDDMHPTASARHGRTINHVVLGAYKRAWKRSHALQLRHGLHVTPSKNEPQPACRCTAVQMEQHSPKQRLALGPTQQQPRQLHSLPDLRGTCVSRCHLEEAKVVQLRWPLHRWVHIMCMQILCEACAWRVLAGCIAEVLHMPAASYACDMRACAFPTAKCCSCKGRIDTCMGVHLDASAMHV